MAKSSEIIPIERIQNSIYLIRKQKVMLDKDLASLYGVKPIALRQQVKRNSERFPADFMYQLTDKEVVILLSQNVIASRKSLGGHNPYVFTEQGVAMLSSVLKSKRAMAVNIAIMRTFVKLREILGSNELLRRKIESMERKYDEKFEQVFAVLENMLTEESKPKRQIGFHTEAKGQKEQAKKGKGKR
ncbi:MAG: ORF6N domain-containing protein [Planctomycetota bacterium]|jgi:hypothetical protein